MSGYVGCIMEKKWKVGIQGMTEMIINKAVLGSL